MENCYLVVIAMMMRWFLIPRLTIREMMKVEWVLT